MGSRKPPQAVSDDLRRAFGAKRLERVLAALSESGAFLFAPKEMVGAGVFQRGRGKRGASIRLTEAEALALLASGALDIFRREAKSVRYRLNAVGRSALARLRHDGPESAAFGAAQREPMARAVQVDPGARPKC